MKFPSVGCLVNRHKPIRNRVKITDEYTGVCKHCGTSIRRVQHGRWEKHKLNSAVPAE